MAQERRVILFGGRVQGVGFRYTTIELAEDLPLAGTVRNLSDGRVELIVEGPPASIDQLVKLLRERFGGFIRTVEQSIHAPQGLPRGIQVGY
jgi:acylphosphatase